MRARINSAFATTLPLLLCLMSNVEASRHRHQQQHHQSDSSVQTHSSPSSPSLAASSSSSSSERTSSHERSSSTITYHSPTNNNRLKTKSIYQRINNLGNEMRSAFTDTSPNESPNLMRQYMERRLFQCSSNYLGIIAKLNEVIELAHEEYRKCEEMMRVSPKNFNDTPFAALNDLLKEWKEEEESAEEENSSSSIEIENVDELRRPQTV